MVILMTLFSKYSLYNGFCSLLGRKGDVNIWDIFFSVYSPRTEMTAENLRWLENVFRQTVGENGEIRLQDFKNIVHSKNVSSNIAALLGQKQSKELYVRTCPKKRTSVENCKIFLHSWATTRFSITGLIFVHIFFLSKRQNIVFFHGLSPTHFDQSYGKIAQK